MQASNFPVSLVLGFSMLTPALTPTLMLALTPTLTLANSPMAASASMPDDETLAQEQESDNKQLRFSILKAVAGKNLDALATLIDQGTDINLVLRRDGSSAIHLAATTGHLPILRHLIENGANINQTDGRNRTALHLALVSNRSDAAELLIASGADVETADSTTGETPLHIAVNRQNLELIDRLLEVGADVWTTDKQGSGLLIKVVADPPSNSEDRIIATLDRLAAAGLTDMKPVRDYLQGRAKCTYSKSLLQALDRLTLASLPTGTRIVPLYNPLTGNCKSAG